MWPQALPRPVHVCDLPAVRQAPEGEDRVFYPPVSTPLQLCLLPLTLCPYNVGPLSISECTLLPLVWHVLA